MNILIPRSNTGPAADSFRFQGKESGKNPAPPSFIRSNRGPLWRSQKCIPGAIRCMRCMNLGIEDCTYEWVKKRGVGRTLKMGEACEYCRSATASEGAC